MFRAIRKRKLYSTTWQWISEIGTRLVIATITIIIVMAGLTAAQEPDTGRYASLNGLTIYNEIYGSAEPIMLLHGAFGTISGPMLDRLAKDRQVIAVELQGHGHTGDIDQPLSFEQMMDDVAALLKDLKLDRADIFGYSAGGTVALYAAIKFPSLVNKLAILGSSSTPDAWDPETFNQFRGITVENFDPSPLKDPNEKTAPAPKNSPFS
jgi:pimeloyl-ACP methyl ester carboxylesterase